MFSSIHSSNTVTFFDPGREFLSDSSRPVHHFYRLREGTGGVLFLQSSYPSRQWTPTGWNLITSACPFCKVPTPPGASKPVTVAIMSGADDRRLQLGANPSSTGTAFCVWAPDASAVSVVFKRQPLPQLALSRTSDGFFVGKAKEAKAGDLYKFSVDEAEAFPDPVSRFQPDGPHGFSEIINPKSYKWGAAEKRWPGVGIAGQVLYEMHVGTFTREGTFAAASAEFPRLRRLGITTIECMPLAEFSGKTGWGYDGVDLFAPFHHYGRPDDLRHMVEAAHQHGLGIILDVVYNHLGPDGNHLANFSKYYFSDRSTEWGGAINFDGHNSGPVRDFFLANTERWIAEYHFDGLRLDATQSIHDESAQGPHILAEIGSAVRAAAGTRRTIVLAENEPQDCCLITPLEQGGYGLDAVWNDDFHHSAIVALTGRRQAYFTDHLGRPQEFISAAKYGYLYQGQYYSWQKGSRGSSAIGLDPSAFITFLENHDQVANVGLSQRVRSLTSPARYRAMTGLWLLGPGTPMFFQGQEYGAETPFHYFADHSGDLAKAVSTGRREFMMQFANQDTPEMKRFLCDPEDHKTFVDSQLDPAEQTRYPEVVQLHMDLLAIRRTERALFDRRNVTMDGAVLGENCFLIRYLTIDGDDRLLVVNFGVGVDLPSLPEPLAAPPRDRIWKVLWSSEHPKYGGIGSSAPGRFGAWHLTGECTQLLVPARTDQSPVAERPKSGLKEDNPKA